MKKNKIPERLSYSLLKDYERCPLLFFYRHILDLELPIKSVHLVFGKSLHKALELYAAEQKDLDITFKEDFKIEDVEKEELAKFLEYRNTGLAMLEQFKEISKELKIVKTEQKILAQDIIDKLTGEKLKFRQLTGIIDFITEDKCCGDYKTSSHKYTQEEVDSSMQPTIYALLYYLTYKELPREFIYIVFLKKRKKDFIQILKTKRSFEDISAFITKANQLYRKIEERDFEKNHDDFGFCDCKQYTELLKV
jgi:RecB family exonuclease